MDYAEGGDLQSRIHQKIKDKEKNFANFSYFSED